MPFLVNGDAWTADYGFTLNAADRFLPHLSSTTVPYGSDHVDHVPLFLTMSCLRCFHPRLFWQILVTVIKSFTLNFIFFLPSNILAAQVTTVRLSVDCVGSGRIVLFAPIGRASHHLSRSHFSTWVVKICPQSNPCCFHSPSVNASLPECVNKRVGNRSLCAKDDIYENQWLPKKRWSKTQVPPPLIL